jgi:hypothetical protein
MENELNYLFFIGAQRNRTWGLSGYICFYTDIIQSNAGLAPVGGSRILDQWKLPAPVESRCSWPLSRRKKCLHVSVPCHCFAISFSYHASPYFLSSPECFPLFLLPRRSVQLSFSVTEISLSLHHKGHNMTVMRIIRKL